MWDPQRYLTFADQRGRPFADLVSRIGASTPREVADLGCGPGNLTVTLARRWPEARVVGVDSSPEMLEAARERAGSEPGVEFVEADLRGWEPKDHLDVLVSNATLQWVPDHLEVLPRLASFLAPGGWLAFQVPGNFSAPTHTLLRELVATPRWRDLAGIARPATHEPAVYLDALLDCGLAAEAWETTYLHLLTGDDAVFTWMSGTGLRPVLAALDEPDRAEFVAAYKAVLREAYPAGRHGVVLPYRRIFAVAQQADRS